MMVGSQHHRGPDAAGTYVSPCGTAGLGHNRLSIIDLSAAGTQPMTGADGRLVVVFNGEIYNYRELRSALAGYPFRTATDTEVILAAYARWGEDCLDHFIGMFALCIWDEVNETLFAARDRFGVKPLYYHVNREGTLRIASEIKALQAVGLGREPDAATWATYLAAGLSDCSSATFWQDVASLPPGHALKWERGHITSRCWYDLADRVGDLLDSRSDRIVQDECFALMAESVQLRFRSDVPVGIALSGGLDSSTLLGLVQKVQGVASQVETFTYVTGDLRYDELPWVEEMLARTQHPSTRCLLTAEEVPALAESVQGFQDEPFGGLPNLGYARMFERAKAAGVTVVLDGQGLDEQWAGYDYYSATAYHGTAIVQGTTGSAVRPDALTPEFRLAAKPVSFRQPFPDLLRNLQYRDVRYSKMPRALRFNDRVSMRASIELREPFLDHRLFELAFRQPLERKLCNGTGKWLIRQGGSRLLPLRLVEAPKRPVSTPQREWLRGPLQSWASDCIERALEEYGDTWLNSAAVRSSWKSYCDKGADNSHYVWQWISLGLAAEQIASRSSTPASVS